MKTCYNAHELRPRFKGGQQAIVTRQLEAKIQVRQKQPDRETITVTMYLHVGAVCVGVLSYDEASLQAVLDAFDIAERSNVWDVFDE